MRGGELIAEYLISEKVPYVFGLCGHGIVGLMDALGQRADRIKMIGVHHEQVAGYMADAYYRVAHRPAATFTSCGPGSVNLTIALACAMMDSSALVAITGNVPTPQWNRGSGRSTSRRRCSSRGASPPWASPSAAWWGRSSRRPTGAPSPSAATVASS